ncbi:MAG: hypothetical protein JJ964_16555 [Rhizobiales bacterium]|nr:hypothetical protein [Hyphomicrobiales bacterium]
MFKIQNKTIFFNGKAIYEAPTKISYHLPYDEDLIVLLDDKGLAEKDFAACSYWALYTKNDNEYWAAGGGDKKYQFDPETGKVLGWAYPKP